jgi:O-acetyl-ADP-ribose deacetylase (regulator of RNase III)
LGEITFVSPVNTPITVQIVQGDLTQEISDAIVNPTDQFGQLNKGVGAQVSYFGGQCIQEEINQIIKQDGLIPTGNVIVTGAGILRAKHLIHAVGPNKVCPSQMGLNLSKLLYFTANNIYSKAVQLNCS